MEEIRRLRFAELDESMALSSFAFQYDLSPQEKEERRAKMKPELTWGYFIDGKLAAKLTIHPFETYIQGKPVRMGGIASVATWPEYRRNGLVAKLLSNALQVMRQNGQSLSFLSPFSFSFYRKFGWEMLMDFKKYTIDAAQLPKMEACDGAIVRTGKDWTLLNGIYEQYAMRFNGMMKRDEHWWNDSVFKGKKGQTAVYYSEAGIPQGYIMYEVKQSEMTIHELVCLNESARKSLWRFIGNHDSMLKKITLKAPMSDQLPFLLDNPKIGQEIVPYFMARIVDVESFMSQYGFLAAESRQSFVLAVEDYYAPWNNGLFDVIIDRCRAQVQARRDEAGSSEGTGSQTESGVLSCTIQSLTAMLLAYQSPSFMHQIGRLQGNIEDVHRLEALIPQRTTYLTDYF